MVKEMESNIQKNEIKLPLQLTGAKFKYSCRLDKPVKTKDDYIEELCEANPELDERYHISSNKGYGTKDHLQGIHTYGITKFHRKSFGLCKTMNAV